MSTQTNNTGDLRIQVPTTGATLGSKKQAEFVTFKIYDMPRVEGGQPIWFANISFLKEQKEVGEAYLNKLVEVGIHHSFVSAEEEVKREAITVEDVNSRFAKFI